MGSAEKISIVVPAYNAEGHIEPCLASLIGQTYSNIEIVVVDDGSTDSTREVVARVSAEDSRVRLVSKSNGGPSLARKEGVGQATGEYICFVDSDDWVESNYCMDLYAAMMATEGDMATCGLFLDYDNGRTELLVGTDGYRVMDRDEALVALHRRSSIFPYSVNKIIARRLFDSADFVAANVVGEDYDMVVQLLENAQRVVHLPKPLYHYVQRSGSASHADFGTYAPSYRNHQRVQQRLSAAYPHLADDIALYHIGSKDLATLFSMSKSDAYDWDIVRDARIETKKHLRAYVSSANEPLASKVAAIFLSASPKLFFAVYGAFATLTGRRKARKGHHDDV